MRRVSQYPWRTICGGNCAKWSSCWPSPQDRVVFLHARRGRQVGKLAVAADVEWVKFRCHGIQEVSFGRSQACGPSGALESRGRTSPQRTRRPRPQEGQTRMSIPVRSSNRCHHGRPSFSAAVEAGGWGVAGVSAVSTVRAVWSLVCTLRPAHKPKWRIRVKACGSTCSRNRRINSTASTVICSRCPAAE